MTNRALIAVVLVAAAVALVVRLRRRPEPALQPAPAPRATAAVTPADPAEEPTAAAVPVPAARLDEARRQLRAAARECYAARPAAPTIPHQKDATALRLAFRYRVTVAGGTARVANLTIDDVDTTLDDGELATCIVGRLAEARWPSSDSGDLRVKDVLYVGDLGAPETASGPPPGPPVGLPATPPPPPTTLPPGAP